MQPAQAQPLETTLSQQVVALLAWLSPWMPVLLLLLCAVGGARMVHMLSAYRLQARMRETMGLGGLWQQTTHDGVSPAWFWCGAAGAAGVLLGFTCMLHGGPGHEWVQQADASWLAWAHQKVAPSWREPLLWLTAAGDVMLLSLLAGAVALWLLRCRRWLELQVWLFFCLFNGLMIRVLKQTFDRARPENVHELLVSAASFPSGHAAGSVLAYLLLAFLLTERAPRWGRVLSLALAGCWVLLIGGSRVMLSVHWFSDVMAGWTLGGMSVLAAVAVLTQLRQAQQGVSVH